MNRKIIAQYRKVCLKEVRDEHGNWCNYLFNEELFAELLIQKCMQLSDQALKNNKQPSNVIKKHFGIKNEDLWMQETILRDAV